MKKYFLLFLLFSALISQAQDYIIKFSGTGASGSVDQVIVENITQNKKIILAKNQYLHLTGNNNNVVQTKSSVSYKTTSANEITMLFKDGDRMRFTGSSGDYSTVISDSPKQSKNFTFRFISCEDGEQKGYPVVQIGNQLWMAKNLASRKLNNGTSIPIHFSPSDYYDPGYKPALYAYGNSSSNFTTYGGLYDWELVWSGKLCPVGWHVPSVDEWETLFNYLGGKNKAGTILKERGFRHWITQNELATDSVGFTALPGGKNTNKEIQYENLGLGAYFWTSDANPLNLANAWFIAIFDDNTPVQIDNYLKNTSSSVRCVYDYEYPVFQNIIDTVICDGTTFNNHDSEGLYRDKFTSAVGYDSVSIINLSFYHSANPEVFISGDTLKSLYVFNNYSWFNINSEIPESYNRNFIIENSGRYYLKVVDEFGCEKTSETIHIYQSAVQDISEDKFSFSVIPNPGNGKFNFKVNSILDESIILKLVNSTGSILFEEKLEPANSVFKSFDLTNVNKGIYYLVIVKGSDKYSEKIIIR